jgi:hypothetical protein
MKSLFILLALFGVSSCEKLEEVLQKGSLDGYFQCIKNNQEKRTLLGENLVRDACTKKHSKKADGGKVFSSCRGGVMLGNKPSVNITGCTNTSNKIITSIKVAIRVKNFDEGNDKASIKLTSKHEPIFLKPGETLNKKIFTNTSALLDDKKGRITMVTPSCNDQSQNICWTWFIDEHKYLDLDI